MTPDIRELRLEVLNDTISVENFSCNKKPESHHLETFLKEDALDNQHKKITVTYVALTKDDEPVGYFSLACGSIDGKNLSKKQKSHLPGRERYPAIYIGRFAVADIHQDKGIGRWLMDNLFARAIHISAELGCRYIIVQSKPTSTGFYEKKFGFIRAIELKNGCVLYYKNMITLTQEKILEHS